jgi:hypothetical protein
MAYVKLVGTKNRHTDWTAEVVVEKDKNGKPSKVLKKDVPVELSADKQKELEAKGYVFEDSSKSEAEKVAEESVSVATDTQVSGPLLGGSETDNQGTGSVFGRSRSDKNN